MSPLLFWILFFWKMCLFAFFEFFFREMSPLVFWNFFFCKKEKYFSWGYKYWKDFWIWKHHIWLDLRLLDGAEPSGNSVSSLNLLKLASYTENSDYKGEFYYYYCAKKWFFFFWENNLIFQVLWKFHLIWMNYVLYWDFDLKSWIHSWKKNNFSSE